MATVGKPYQLDVGYTNLLPPDSVMWMKDGMVYHGDGDRVRVDHKGIVFSNVVSEDYGRYTVMSRNRAGIGSAYTVLKGLESYCM